jgi:hypothetical protein
MLCRTSRAIFKNKNIPVGVSGGEFFIDQHGRAGTGLAGVGSCQV